MLSDNLSGCSETKLELKPSEIKIVNKYKVEQGIYAEKLSASTVSIVTNLQTGQVSNFSAADTVDQRAVMKQIAKDKLFGPYQLQ